MPEVIYEDEYIIVINKPAGILTVPTDKDKKNDLTAKLNGELEARGEVYKAHPCHRLDRETSGAIIYAKGKRNQQIMMKLFHKNEIKKTYIALVSGVPNKKEGVINFKIGGKEALSGYTVIAEKKGYSIVEVELFTGRTNQIRIHFKMIGHPLLGETKYAFRKDFDIKFKRTALHSYSLEFAHPITGAQLNITAEVPNDIKKMF
ncbi:MAG TPA: RluA family pseudouridine synthase [Spirochaetota bacterium]|jgi:RluA family pseudouridine synthase|nr:MAG: Ribosomal large subunit pseudouridine synthase A [Spirochaetes bacterium ADurb.Bin133]HNZ25773.1 RluA family pseudouridine synthase [Spirochaetota bacterium]HPY87010.1 RluA family pseudouridine synthase [Spirochaetota bacterium]